MGLVGLRGGGIPGQASTAISTAQQHPLGTIAVDSSGGEYIYVRGSTTALNVGALVGYNSTVGAFQIALASSDYAVGTGTARMLGINMSTNGSTANFSWVQVAGRSSVAAGDSTLVGPDALTLSTGTAGTFSTAPAANLVFNAQSLSSAASTTWEVYINYPYVSSVAGT